MVRPSAPAASCLVDLLEPVDRLRHGLPVGQRAAEPAVVHVVLRGALGGIGDRLRRLALGADEQDAAVLGHGVADHVQRRVEHRHGLGEVDDVNAVAVTVDVLAHARDSTAGSGGRSERQLPKADASRIQGAPYQVPFRFAPRRSHQGHAGTVPALPNRWTEAGMSPPKAQAPPVKCARPTRRFARHCKPRALACDKQRMTALARHPVHRFGPVGRDRPHATADAARQRRAGADHRGCPAGWR